MSEPIALALAYAAGNLTMYFLIAVFVLKPIKKLTDELLETLKEANK